MDCCSQNAYNSETVSRRMRSFVFALPIFTARAIYRPAGRGCPGDTHRQKKAPTLQSRLGVRVTYFTARASYPLPLKNMPVACFRQRKKPTTFVVSLVFALPIFTASHPATIVGVHELNFCVRDGNRWTLMTINTNYAMDITIDLLPRHISTSILICQELFW